jgi:hypothetical protein
VWYQKEEEEKRAGSVREREREGENTKYCKGRKKKIFSV